MTILPETGTREERFATFTRDLTARLQPLEEGHNRAYWALATTGAEEHLRECTRLDSEMRLVFAQPEPYAFLRELAAAGPLAEALLQRQLVLLLDAFRAKQLPPETIQRQVAIEKRLEAMFTNFRAQLHGEPVSDNRIREVHVGSDDEDLRREAWSASKQVGAEVEAPLLELVRLRNEGARQLGFRDYYAMGLALGEIDEAWLFALLDQLERGTDPLWDAYKGALDARLAARFGVAADALRPWHYADPFFQAAPPAEASLDPFYAGRDLEATAAAYFASVGFDIRRLLGLADLRERPGKNQHAFCMSIERGREIRVLCNLRDDEKWMGTLLHEFGHALYDDHLDPALPWLLRAHAHVLTTEASAMLFGRLSRNAEWLRRWAGADPAELAAIAGPISRAGREQLLVQTRWMLVMIHMERALYADPAQDLRALWWRLVERFQGVRPPAGRHEPDWAAKIHFSIAPVYYHNYLLGEMLASQLQAHLLGGVLGGGPDRWARYVSDPAVGAFLRERLYAPGNRWHWGELVQRATGRPLGSEAFVADLAGRDVPA